MIVILKSIAITRHVYIVQNLSCGMDFSVDRLHIIENEMKSEIQNIRKAVIAYYPSKINETV